MVILTELKQTGPEIFLARFDNGETIRTTLNVVAELALFSGKECSEETLEAIRDASSLSLCKQRAMRLIGLRPMSVRELKDRLKEKGETDENAEAAAQWLVDLRLLNDEDYAGMLVRHYAAKGYGQGRIRNELFRHGISRELWDDALDQLPEQDDQVDRLLRKKLRSAAPDRDELRRAANFLYRRGFRREEISAAIERYRQECEDDSYGI